MATSSVDLCNQALVKIGAQTILDLTQDSKEAKLCGIVFDKVRRFVLRQHPWNCAVTRVTLSPEVTAPAFGYTAQFILPADNLRVLEIKDTDDYRIEGRKVLCDASTLDVLYIRDVTEIPDIDELCGDAISARLAYELSYALSEMQGLKDMMFKEYKDALRKARFVDGGEDPSPIFDADTWLRARLAGSTLTGNAFTS